MRVVLFEGAARADFLYVTGSSATSRRSERSHLLLDRADIHPAIARLPAERPASTNEILRRLENDIPAALARHRNATVVGSPVAAFEEHVVLLGCVESLFALLRDPARAGSLGNKHRASALTADDQYRILATLTPWSDPAAACSPQALDLVLSLLSELAERCDWPERENAFLPALHEPTAPGLFTPPIWSSIPAILKMLVHGPVHAAYFNRGHWQGVLTGDRILLRAIVNLAYASENDDIEGPLDFPELHLTGESRKSLIDCLLPLGQCTPDALLESQSRMFDVFASVAPAAARRHSHAYPRHLESEVFSYLEREGALIPTDAAVAARPRMPRRNTPQKT